MHKALARQVKKAFRQTVDRERQLNTLLDLVDSHYEELDKERRLADRSIQLMSDELMELNRRERERGEHALREGARRLEGLIRTIAKVAGAIEAHETLDAISQEAAELLGVEGAGFRLLEAGRLVVKGSYGLARKIMIKPSIAVGESLTGQVAREGKALTVHGVEQDQRLDPEHKKAAKAHGIVTFAGVPLFYRQRIIGVLNIYGKKRRAFSEEEVNLLRAFGDQAAIAIEQSRLYEQARRDAVELHKEVVEHKRTEKSLIEKTEELETSNVGLAQLTKELAIEKEQAQVTLESIADAVITTNALARIEYLNPVAERLLGWSLAEARGKPIAQVVNVIEEISQIGIDNPVELCLERGQPVKRHEDKVVLIARSGNAVAIDASAAPIRDREGNVTGVVMVFHDVSEARQLTQQMIYQATHDSLTRLPNRVLLMDRLQEALSRAPWNDKIVAILFLDLDRFKLVNDTLGHDVGDDLLRQVATRLQSVLREGDTISRLGGDEFVILLRDMSRQDDIIKVVDKISEVLNQPFFLVDQEIYIKASIGICPFPAGGKDAHELLKNADAAMYQAKATGRNKYVFYDSAMSQQTSKRLRLETDLHRALERDEFKLVYQPQVDAVTEQIICAEALLRWEHSTLGTVSPMEFIPMAEDNGLIVPIGKWVLEEACRQNYAWQQAGLPPITMAVNIADRQFHHANLISVVNEALTASGLDACHLQLELTEGILANDTEAAIAMLTRLRDMGIKLAIDDFGTGYSSFSYLKRFPLDTLKVDRCFVQDITTDPDDAAICAAIIAMARNLNLEVVAEGVETKAQLDFLRRHQCHVIQGYYFSRPVPDSYFTELLTRSCSSTVSKNRISEPRVAIL